MEILAIYAAVVSTVGVCWQIYRWVDDRRTMVAVKAELPVTESPREVAFAIAVVNHSAHEVFISEVALTWPDGHVFLLDLGVRSVQPMEKTLYLISPSTVDCVSSVREQGRLPKMHRARVELSTGETFVSSPFFVGATQNGYWGMAHDPEESSKRPRGWRTRLRRRPELGNQALPARTLRLQIDEPGEEPITGESEETA
jgi:hypothetical protein